MMRQLLTTAAGTFLGVVLGAGAVLIIAQHSGSSFGRYSIENVLGGLARVITDHVTGRAYYYDDNGRLLGVLDLSKGGQDKIDFAAKPESSIKPVDRSLPDIAQPPKLPPPEDELQIEAKAALEGFIAKRWGKRCGESIYAVYDGFFSSGVYEIRGVKIQFKEGSRELSTADLANGMNYESSWSIEGIQRHGDFITHWYDWQSYKEDAFVLRKGSDWLVRLDEKAPKESCEALKKIPEQEQSR